MNPANYKSVPDVQKEALEEKMEEEEQEVEESAKTTVKRRRADNSDSELSPEPEPQNPLEVLGLAEPSSSSQHAATPKPSRADLKELRDRLQERINQLRAKRKANKEPDDAQAPPKKKAKKEKDKKKKKKDKKTAKGSSALTSANGKTEEKGTKGQAMNGVESGNGIAKNSNKRKRSESSNPDTSTETAHAEKSTEESTERKPKVC